MALRYQNDYAVPWLRQKPLSRQDDGFSFGTLTLVNGLSCQTTFTAQTHAELTARVPSV